MPHIVAKFMQRGVQQTTTDPFGNIAAVIVYDYNLPHIV